MRDNIVRELTKEELIDFNGGNGEPTLDTPLSYDIAYYIGKGVRWIVDLF